MKKTLKFISVCTIIASLAATQLSPAAMAFGSAVVNNGAESSDLAQTILAVKEKIEIPEGLTEFRSEYTNDYIGRNIIELEWYSKDESYNNLIVEADRTGRILGYYKYGDYDYGSSSYVGVTRAQAQEYAEAFLRRVAPEAFADENDRYVYEDYYCEYYSDVSYTFEFARYRNGSKVRSNDAVVTVYIYGDKMDVRTANIGFDYNAVFEGAGTEIADADTIYKQKFPLEMVYTDYRKKNARNEWEDDTYLAYRSDDAGYISAYTGEVVEEEENEAVPLYKTSESATADLAAGASNGVELSDAELAEVEQISTLMSEEDCIRFLKGIPMLKFSEIDIASQFTGLRATDEEHNEYMRYIHYREPSGGRDVSANVDAVRGKLLYFSDTDARNYGKEALSEAEIAEGNAKIDEFLNLVVSDVLDEFVRAEKNERDNELARRYERVVNEIPYVNDSLYIDYNPEKEIISSYSLDYNHHAEFAAPDSAVVADTAYNNLLAAAPLEKAYVKFGEKYKLVYYLTMHPLMNALTGEILSSGYNTYDPTEVEYTDIDNHWSKDKVTFLKDLGVAFEGTEFNPDSQITQADILRIFATGTGGIWYMTEDIERIYNRAYSCDAVTEEERSDDSAVTREQAFKYMVCFMNYGDVAKLSDIYKIEYADGNMLSDGMIGYAAILSGMDIINGDGSIIRPKDYITRAEALTMVYNYLTSPMR